MMEEKRLRAYLRILLAEGVGTILFRRLVEVFGDVEGVCRAGKTQWKRVKGIGDKTTAALGAVTDELIDEELALLETHGVSVLCIEDDDYPKGLKAIHDPPPILYVRGNLEPTDAVALGVVGSRRCTHYGLEQGERFAQLLGRAGFTVVSGGARGIDTAAHRGSLLVGGRTIAVMGCGLSQTYPRENEKLFERIVDEQRGAIISELPMRTAVLSGNFPTRNRIISGLSLGVLVVEAALHSGALLTADTASEQGREVFVLPGRVDSPVSQGTHELIRSGATLVTDLDQILDELGEVGAKMSPEQTSIEETLLPALSDVERKLLLQLTEHPLNLDELVRQTGIETAKVASAMTMLVLKGAVVQQPGNVFARKTNRMK